jgi:hypothetical protein
MANFIRMLVGIALLPACWGVARSLVDATVAATGAAGAFGAESIALLGGIAAFALCWTALPHPVRTYVLGHELTHAAWGLLFGAVPSSIRVGERGGSVRLTKTNMLITLAPYFFPFYTFVVIVVALATYAFARPLPLLPLWMFMIGFTWAFHVLFTLETLTERQPDVKIYGRIFSWTFIFMANVLLVLAFLAATTPVTFADVGHSLAKRVIGAYVSLFSCAASLVMRARKGGGS